MSARNLAAPSESEHLYRVAHIFCLPIESGNFWDRGVCRGSTVGMAISAANQKARCRSQIERPAAPALLGTTLLTIAPI